jgi:hypothetical protein
MSELFLIAHKVRGLPAFDIAEKIKIGDEEGWIIPTSGHRAYPYWWVSLEEIGKNPRDRYFESITFLPSPMPYHWPDHYTVNNATEAKVIATILVDALTEISLEELGL